MTWTDLGAWTSRATVTKTRLDQISDNFSELKAHTHDGTDGDGSSAITPVSVTASGLIKSTSASAGIGYATGAGGTQTQGTSKSTSVTLNTICGQITTHNANLNAGASVIFQLANSRIAAGDVAIVNVADNAATDNVYRIEVAMIGAGFINLRLTNTSGGNLAEAVRINFAVIKAVTS